MQPSSVPVLELAQTLVTAQDLLLGSHSPSLQPPTGSVFSCDNKTSSIVKGWSLLPHLIGGKTPSYI